MKNFETQKADFLNKVLPLLESEFQGAENKQAFLDKWIELVKDDPFCQLRFSVFPEDLDLDMGEGFHCDFTFNMDYGYIDCTRKTNPDCSSGEKCFSFGSFYGQSDHAFIHTDTRNMDFIYYTDIYEYDDIDAEVLSSIKSSGFTFQDLVKSLKPEVTYAVIMNKSNRSQWLQIERSGRDVIYSCNINPDKKWDSGEKSFETENEAQEFLIGYMENLLGAELDLNRCSDDIRSVVTAKIEKSIKP